MTEKNITVFHRIYKILLSISIIAAGLCLIYGCLSIYYSGDHAYSRQIVAETFSTIAVPVYICLGLLIVSIVLNLIIPAVSTKSKPSVSYKNRLQLLLTKKDLTACNGEQLSAIKKERTRRKLATVIQAAVISASSLVFLVYALNGEHYDNSQINSSVINAMWVLLPCLCVMFAASVIAEIYREKSFKQECELISKLPSAKSANAQNTSETNKCNKKILIIRCAVLVAGIGILIYGFLSGGVADVLTKAVNICTECIGLG